MRNQNFELLIRQTVTYLLEKLDEDVSIFEEKQKQEEINKLKRQQQFEFIKLLTTDNNKFFDGDFNTVFINVEQLSKEEKELLLQIARK